MDTNNDRYGMTYEQHEAKRKKTKLLLLGILCALVLFLAWVPFGLDSATALEGEIKESLPAGMSAVQKEAVLSTLAVWDDALPGLSRIRKDLRFERVEYGSPYTGFSREASVTWLLFSVNNDSRYASTYRANGHVLRVGIVEDGSGILLQKESTQSVFLDQQMDSQGRDYFIPMR